MMSSEGKVQSKTLKTHARTSFDIKRTLGKIAEKPYAQGYSAYSSKEWVPLAFHKQEIQKLKDEITKRKELWFECKKENRSLEARLNKIVWGIHGL